MNDDNRQSSGSVQRTLSELAARCKATAQTHRLLLVAPAREDIAERIRGRRPEHISQFYSRAQIDSLADAFAAIGFSVEIFPDENAFLKSASLDLDRHMMADSIVYAIGECGFGPGRRALIPAFCQFNNIKYINSGPTANCIARNKWLAYSILTKHSIRMPKTWHYRIGNGWFQQRLPENNLEVILKPNYESMCVGIDDNSVFLWCDKGSAYVEAFANSFDGEVIVQEFIPGLELGVPVISTANDIQAIGCVGYKHRESPSEYWLKARTNHDECTEGVVQNYDPTMIESETLAQMHRTAEEAARLLTVEGFCRIDFRLDAECNPFVIDTNESPPPLMQSAVGSLLARMGFSHGEYLSMLAELGLRRRDFG